VRRSAHSITTVLSAVGLSTDITLCHAATVSKSFAVSARTRSYRQVNENHVISTRAIVSDPS